MTEDLVSIITPSYNTAPFIAETIESVLSQTYPNWEMIIVDDCSTDNTDEVVARYTADSRIRYYKNEKNSGAAFSRNFALRKARGRYIAFLDSDDLWMPEKLEKQLKFMTDHGVSFSCCGTAGMREDGTPTGRYTRRPRHVGKFGMKMYCWPGCLGVMYDAGVVGLIQIAHLKKNNDYAMWLKVIKKCDFYGFNDVLTRYRARQGSISHDKIARLIRSHYVLWREGENKNPLSATLLTFCNLFFGVLKKKFYIKNTPPKVTAVKEDSIR